MGDMLSLADHRRRPSRVGFSRGELQRILNLYSRRVASGEWRDYAIDHLEHMAAFSVFRHAFDRPLFTIAKRRGGGVVDYLLYASGSKLKHSRSIDEVLEALETRPRAVS
jgi:hypothetical protein